MKEPKIIQGGMGAGVSNWRLAREVSRAGHLGVVSGIAMDVILARRLQSGDNDGHMRRALKHFPVQSIAERIVSKYFVEGGPQETYNFKQIEMHSIDSSRELIDLTIAGTFTEVFLAKEGHEGLVGINLLEKIRLPNLASLYGAMLAGVDYVIMGAGIPREIPKILDMLALNQKVSLTLSVQGASTNDEYTVSLDPREIMGVELAQLNRPKFLAIVSSNVLATTMIKKSSGRVDGLIIEGQSAGGHNAPPRGKLVLSEHGEPVYGPKDEVDIERIKKLNVPFWLAGSFGEAGKLQEALNLGAVGIQIGTLFAFCEESGLMPEIKQAVLKADSSKVFTDPLASPTGFPFKVLKLKGSIAEEDEYLRRPRICNLGYLRNLYKRSDGAIGYRCPAEPVSSYVAKGGKIEDTAGRKCLCNALLADIGLPMQYRNGYLEKPLVTVGDSISIIKSLVRPEKSTYTARDVLDYLLGD